MSLREECFCPQCCSQLSLEYRRPRSAAHWARARVALLILLLAALIVTVLLYSALVRNTGPPLSIEATINTIGAEAYWDAGCMSKVNTISWELLEGGSREVWFYLKSIENVPVNLTPSATNWNPRETESYMILTGLNFTNPLLPNGILHVGLKLDVSSEISPDLGRKISFEITISRSGARVE